MVGHSSEPIIGKPQVELPNPRSFRLALVGASVRSAAQSALRAGYQPVGADLFADSDLEGKNRFVRITDYPAGLASWLAQTPCAGWIYTGGLENYPNQHDFIIEQLK